jgi:hypothetical protein
MEQKMTKQTKLEIAVMVLCAVCAFLIIWRFYDWLA